MYTLIIQAGGKGTRLKSFTKNKPKALLSINTLPLISNIINKLGDNKKCSKVIILCDYKEEIFAIYLPFLKSFHKNIVIELLSAKPYKGTSSGLKSAIERFQINDPILFAWCDLFLENDISYYLKLLDKIEKISKKITIFYSPGVKCRWSFASNQDKFELNEKTDYKKGVLGIFYIPNNQLIAYLNYSGEFVKAIRDNVTSSNLNFCEIENVSELGDFNRVKEIYSRNQATRFFNNITFTKFKVKKSSIISKFDELIQREFNWYKKVSKLGFKDIPLNFHLDNENVLTLEKVKGRNIFDINEEKELLDYTKKCFFSLSNLHSLGNILACKNSLKEVYLNKTIDRLNLVINLLPSKYKKLIINHKECKNLIAYKNWETRLSEIFLNVNEVEFFTPIHGDPTFSNNLMRYNNQICHIDPRGYFYNTDIYGDPRYDLAKLLYSVKGGYDFFNRKLYEYEVNGNQYEYKLWRNEKLFVSSIKWLENNLKNLKEIRILHAFIWLSLTGYCLDDYDSIVMSYIIGCEYLDPFFDNEK